jgi:16S rRNA (cytidine1402-2'-O)-methyltransferase
MKGTLFVTATPIGNLEDITLRAIKVLNEVDIVAAEDTRRTLKLLNHYNIKKPILSYYEYNKFARGNLLIKELLNNKNIALVTDAGTPGISDPGIYLVNLAINNMIPVVPIPGPSALITALSISGLTTNKFSFYGFISRKKGKRKKDIESIRDYNGTVILYESPKRLIKTLKDIHEVCGNRKVVIARELTKLHEEVIRDNIIDIINRFSNRDIKGEITILISSERND